MPKQKLGSGDLGATGSHPIGHFSPDDEGEIRFDIAVHAGRVLIDFGKPVYSIRLNPDQAARLAEILIRRAGEARWRT